MSRRDARAQSLVVEVTPRRGEDADDAILSAEGLSFGYDRQKLVIEALSFAIEEGEFVTLLGPSGCGKTTLLNLVAGFIFPTGGALRFYGTPIQGPGPERAVVFQSGALFEWMTARSNIEFSLMCQGVPAAERHQTSDDLIELVGLRGCGDQYPYELSGGMRQRIGVARVIAARPKIMLMDEPFAAVDVQTRESLQEEVLRIHAKTKCTTLFITHSIEEAVFLSDRVLLLSAPNGVIRDEFQVSLPEPRWDPMNRLDDEFIRLREKIYVEMRQAVANTGDEK